MGGNTSLVENARDRRVCYFCYEGAVEEGQDWDKRKVIVGSRKNCDTCRTGRTRYDVTLGVKILK
jgi:hypothetical protein